MNALAVIAWSIWPARAVTTVTPVANRPMARRYAEGSGVSVRSEPAAADVMREPSRRAGRSRRRPARGPGARSSRTPVRVAVLAWCASRAASSTSVISWPTSSCRSSSASRSAVDQVLVRVEQPAHRGLLPLQQLLDPARPSASPSTRPTRLVSQNAAFCTAANETSVSVMPAAPTIWAAMLVAYSRSPPGPVETSPKNSSSATWPPIAIWISAVHLVARPGVDVLAVAVGEQAEGLPALDDGQDLEPALRRDQPGDGRVAGLVGRDQPRSWSV